MRLIKQVRLYFQEGTSDKVYEIDLCQVGDEHVVNFRYGRRGGVLKEGTKTVFPVSLSEAESIIQKLEQEKRNKGYLAEGESATSMADAAVISSELKARKKTIVKILKKAIEGNYPDVWLLSRVIWRAGELKIGEAIPFVVKLAQPEDALNIYSVVWAIGRCKASEQLPYLADLKRTEKLPPHVTELIELVIFELSEGAGKTTLIDQLIAQLPLSIGKSIEQNDTAQLDLHVRDVLLRVRSIQQQVLGPIFKLSRTDGQVRRVLLDLLPDLPFQREFFRYIRHFYKASELLDDHEVFGILVKRMEEEQARYGQGVFSEKTRSYFMRRSLRRLRRAGEVADISYVGIATGLLLAFDDDRDQPAPLKETIYAMRYDERSRRNEYVETDVHYDVYCQHTALYEVLYQNSDRYVRVSKRWRCVAPYQPGTAAPEKREEAYPHLWDKAPAQILTLLQRSRCARVHDFALKVYMANQDFENHTGDEHVCGMMLAYHSDTQKLGLQLARKRYDINNPSRSLILAALDSSLTEAGQQAREWLVSSRTQLLQDSPFLAYLIMLRQLSVHQWLQTYLEGAYFLREQAEVIVGRVLTMLLSDRSGRYTAEHIDMVGDTLVHAFKDQLKFISLDVITDLFAHEEAALQTLGGKLLLHHSMRPEDLPEELLMTLLNATYANSRKVGIELLARFPEHLLLEKKTLLLSFCLSPLADVRQAIRPVVAMLNGRYPEVGEEVVSIFLPAFFMKERYEGLHDDLFVLLTDHLGASLSGINKEQTMLLLCSRSHAAQRLGAFLLFRNIPEQDLSVAELVKLADNALLQVRRYVWGLFEKYVQKIKYHKVEAIRVTDAEWDDTRSFAFDFFRNNLSENEWDLDLLVSLCDSVREDVQAFGKEMITRCFESDQGEEYLLKLSQHPGIDMQLFTTSYLEHYAGDRPEVIMALESYFITVLSGVNKGKMAKARVMAFIQKEAMKDEGVAKLVMDLLTRVSLTVAITEKAACIVGIRKIMAAYPHLTSPMKVKEYSVYKKS